MKKTNFFSMIFAVSKNGIIGNDESANYNLPWKHLKADMSHFAKLSKKKDRHGNPAVMIAGRKTFESWNCRILPNRLLIVVTENTDYRNQLIVQYPDLKGREDLIILHSKKSVLKYLDTIPNEEIVVCGGRSIWEMFMDEIGVISRTTVDIEAEGNVEMIDIDLHDKDTFIAMPGKTRAHCIDDDNPHDMVFEFFRKPGFYTHEQREFMNATHKDTPFAEMISKLTELELTHEEYIDYKSNLLLDELERKKLRMSLGLARHKGPDMSFKFRLQLLALMNKAQLHPTYVFMRFFNETFYVTTYRMFLRSILTKMREFDEQPEPKLKGSDQQEHIFNTILEQCLMLEGGSQLVTLAQVWNIASQVHTMLYPSDVMNGDESKDLSLTEVKNLVIFMLEQIFVPVYKIKDDTIVNKSVTGKDHDNSYMYGLGIDAFTNARMNGPHTDLSALPMNFSWNRKEKCINISLDTMDTTVKKSDYPDLYQNIVYEFYTGEQNALMHKLQVPDFKDNESFDNPGGSLAEVENLTMVLESNGLSLYEFLKYKHSDLVLNEQSV